MFIVNLISITFESLQPSSLERSSLESKNEKLLLKCFNCNNYYEKKFNKELIKKFKNTYSFCNNDLNKFILLQRKGVYPYEYMIVGKNLMKLHCQVKNHFIAT